MPTRKVNPTDALERVVATKIESGLYDNASEVVGAARRTLARDECEYDARLLALRSAIDAGDASDTAEEDVFARDRTNLGLFLKPREAGGGLPRVAEADLQGLAATPGGRLDRRIWHQRTLPVRTRWVEPTVKAKHRCGLAHFAAGHLIKLDTKRIQEPGRTLFAAHPLCR